MTAQIVFIALQANEEMRPVIDAIEADNPHATVNRCRWLCKSAQIWRQGELVGLNVRSACSKAAHLSGAVITKKGC
ncbi:Phenol hydroxylase, P2 regulatory component DmpM [Cupriavidus necator H850]|uniref:MmoB/DmpM family protein n=1 Tax=Cupriavidus necator TaxID=106590 RepID=UPI00129E781B|nr:MmoB/DmpM family protein [Cupriavidus necator]KAI3603368.1 Phenol hydroxylase, P2 regulatory component DmpM [Cupriavidus necator H850]